MEPYEAPDLIGAVGGWRRWQARFDTLRPIIKGAAWEPGVNEAVCAQGRRHPAPNPRCGCGLYALHGVGRAHLYSAQGVVRAWGSIEVHAGGFRAQYAEVVALAPGITDCHLDLGPLARRYGVPLVSPAELVELLAEIGPVPEQLRPDPAPPEEAVSSMSRGFVQIADSASAAFAEIGKKLGQALDPLTNAKVAQAAMREAGWVPPGEHPNHSHCARPAVDIPPGAFARGGRIHGDVARAYAEHLEYLRGRRDA